MSGHKSTSKRNAVTEVGLGRVAVGGGPRDRHERPYSDRAPSFKGQSNDRSEPGSGTIGKRPVRTTGPSRGAPTGHMTTIPSRDELTSTCSTSARSSTAVTTPCSPLNGPSRQPGRPGFLGGHQAPATTCRRSATALLLESARGAARRPRPSSTPRVAFDSDTPSAHRHRRLVENHAGAQSACSNLARRGNCYLRSSVIRHGGCRFVSTAAGRLPLRAIAEIMLGVSPALPDLVPTPRDRAPPGIHEYQDPDKPGTLPPTAGREIFAASDLASQRDVRRHLTTLIQRRSRGAKLQLTRVRIHAPADRGRQRTTRL